MLSKLFNIGPGPEDDVFDAGALQMGLAKDFSPDTNKNNYTVADVTVADFPGYAGLKNITNWKTVISKPGEFINPDNALAITSGDVLEWKGTATGDWTVKGYYVMMDTDLMWFELFADPTHIRKPNEGVRVVPVFTLHSEF